MENKKEKQYISDVVDLSKMRKDCFNLIASSCGTGKSHFIANYLLEKMPDIQPCEVMLLTSRGITVDQHTYGEYSEYLNKFNIHDIDTIKQWNGDSAIADLATGKIQTMTYDKLIYILRFCNTQYSETLKRIKVIVFDECHVLFSDVFIENIAALKIWIKERLDKGATYFLGMTATPQILFYNQLAWGVKVNQLNDEVLVHYKVQNLICTSYVYLPYLLKKFSGKTIIMCYSIADCFKLQEKISNSVVLISKSNKEYNRKNMEYIREYIIKYNSLPDKVMVDGKEVAVDVLITTSTLREGINLNEESGIKNAICCIPDELHINQFVGRCRFDIENLVIVSEYIQRMNKRSDFYLKECHEQFKEFIMDKTQDGWLNRIKPLLTYPETAPIRINFDEESFYNYIKSEWLNKKIYKDEDKDMLLDIAIGCKLFNKKPSDTSFIALIKKIESSGIFDIVSGRSVVGGHKYTYKIIKLKE